MGCLSSCLCVENCQDYKFQLWWSCDTAPAFSGITIPTHLNPLNCLIAPPTIRANNMWVFFPPQRKINKVHWFRSQHNWKLILRTSRLVFDSCSALFLPCLPNSINKLLLVPAPALVKQAYILGYSSASALAVQEGMQDKRDYSWVQLQRLIWSDSRETVLDWLGVCKHSGDCAVKPWTVIIFLKPD